MSEQKESKVAYSNKLMSINKALMPAIEEQFEVNGLVLDDYQKQCGLNCLSAINSVLDGAGISFTDPALDQSNLSQIITKVVALKLNASATPRECYFQVRNINIKKNGKGTSDWKKQIEFGIEGDGHDALLRNFGVDVKKVHKPWLVREKDEFVYPKHTGIKVTDPVWKETGEGKVIRVVYPVEMNDGSIQWCIAERADVKRNLVAHINNNMMNATFGFCEDRYKATSKQKEQIAAKKLELKKMMDNLSLEDILNKEELQEFISPAWTEGHSREAMIERKLRNNCIRKFPKNFGNGFIEKLYQETTDTEYAEAKNQMEAEANKGPVVDVEYQEVDEKETDGQGEDLEHEKINSETGEIIEDATEEEQAQMELGE
ncbi:MAG: hypothetical protein AB9836_04960 [Aminipila sp.]